MHDNIYAYNNTQLISYIDDKELSALRMPPHHDRSWLINNALHKQAELIKTALTYDAIEYLGLHKLIDFELLGTFKPLWIALFTKYIPIKAGLYNFTPYKLRCIERIKSTPNKLLLLNDKQLAWLVSFTTYRLNHLKLINDIVYNENQQAENNYVQFITNESHWEYPYPFLEE